MKKLKPILLTLLIFISHCLVYSQTTLKGRVFDAKTGKPMPFVNVLYNQQKQGCISDVDGYFTIDNVAKIDYLQCSFVGYHTLKTHLQANCEYVELKMQPETFTLNEVTVLPGENPADRIVNLVIDNKENNNPENLESYKFTSYSKMIFTANLDDVSDEVKRDSAGNVADTSSLGSMVDFLEQHHLFLLESVTEKIFQSPDKSKERILATRVSGLDHPSFTYLASEFQSFSMYGEIIRLAESEYVGPVCKNSPKKYFFLLQDTLYSPQGDTTFIMSFKPKRGTNFDGLEGVLYVNSDGWAIQNIIAKPVQKENVVFKIDQQYEKLYDKHWFPTQLNTEIKFNNLSVGGQNTDSTYHSTCLVAIGKTYIKDIEVNGDFQEKIKSGAEVVYDDKSTKRDSLYWNKYRVGDLDTRDYSTYQLIDSLGEEFKFDEVLEFLELAMTSRLPLGKVNLCLDKLIAVNKYEGVRLGAGLETNHKLSKYFALAGYGAYGFNDKKFKYGGGVRLYPLGNSRLSLSADYSHDIRRTNDYNFGSAGLFNTENYRLFFDDRFNQYTSYSASVKAMLFRGFYVNSYIDFNDIKYNEDYPSLSNFKLAATGWETGLKLKWIIRENIVRTPKGSVIGMGSKYPDLYFNVRRGFRWKDPKFTPYWRCEARFHHLFRTKWFGDFDITVDAAQLFSEHTAVGQQFYPHTAAPWLDADRSFATMQQYEFISDRFVAVFLRYNLKSLLFRTKNWQPELAFVTNMMVGDVFKTYQTNCFVMDNALVPRKGYIESGVQFDALLRISIVKYGCGVYYRYGPYALPKVVDNFAIKLRLIYDF